MGSPGLEAFFLDGQQGRMFCLLHAPRAGTAVRGSVLCLPPFAEEMHKARRMIALQARALAADGWWVLRPDLHGCGDSEGDFADATWSGWIGDASLAARWLRDKSGSIPVLWGLRAGCLLAAAVANAEPEVNRLLFWQPVVSGKQHLQQFLRMKVAGGMLAEHRKGADGTRELRERLLAGESIEVAGYALSAGVAAGLDQARLAIARQGGGHLVWLEVSGAAEPAISVAANTSIVAWQAAGWKVASAALAGASFWQTQEIEEVPALIALGTASLADAQ
jgi:exosortase A-associated hydrolase 2